MKEIKRLEIVADARRIKEICRVLEDLRVSGYTVVPAVTGHGDRGIRSGDELSGVFENSLLLTTCAADELDDLVEAIRPVLKKFGGVCLVSDARWVVH